MKATLYTIFVFAICHAQDDGQYIPDDSGTYFPTANEGRYIPDDSGKYIPDYSGLYHPDGSGKYTHDARGKDRGPIGNYYKRNTIYENNLAIAGTALKPKYVKVESKPLDGRNKYSSDINRVGRYDESKWKIIRQINDADHKGYHWEYETENKINAEESGKVDKKNTDEETLKTNGHFSYTGPDNILYSIVYTADENGFIPKGPHIPVSLQKALAQISSGKI